jgi:hypothetical protein
MVVAAEEGCGLIIVLVYGDSELPGGVKGRKSIPDAGIGFSGRNRILRGTEDWLVSEVTDDLDLGWG